MLDHNNLDKNKKRSVDDFSLNNDHQMNRNLAGGSVSTKLAGFGKDAKLFLTKEAFFSTFRTFNRIDL